MTDLYVHQSGLLVHHEWVAPLRSADLADFDALFRAGEAGGLHKGSLPGWRRRAILRVGDATCFLKTYDRPPLGERVRRRLRGFESVAAAEWHWLRVLGDLGIAAPVPVAYGRRGGLVGGERSLLLTAAVPGESLERIAREPGHALLGDAAARRRIGEALADLARRLHGAGIIHRDLYLSHVFLDGGDDSAVGRAAVGWASGPPTGEAPAPLPQQRPVPPRLALIDLARAIRPWVFRWRWMVKDLASLEYSTPARAATRADRVRWFKRYRGRTGERLSFTDRLLLRAVIAKARRIGRHSRKRGLG